MLSRRTILSGVGSAALLTACGQGGSSASVTGAAQKAAETKRQIDKVGLQTYTLRNALAEDFKGTFQMIKDVGYDFVELNDRNFSEKTPAELKAMLDEIGLPCPSSHMGYAKVKDELPFVIQTAKTLQTDYMVVPYMADNLRSLEDWKRHAVIFNAAGEQLADEGVRLAYHNHQFEFDDLGGGTTAIEILMNETDPRFVDFQLDIFWTNIASINVADLMRKYPGRFKLCHIKDLKGDPKSAANMSYEDIGANLMQNVGEGDTDFESVFALNDISGMEYFVAENDFPKTPYRGSIATSLSSIRNMRF